MALTLNTFGTGTAIGNREDLTDVIYRISPTITPFLNLAAKTKASAMTHEWQVQDLAAAASNAVAEGADATTKTVTPTVRLQSRTQISSKSVSVSGTQQSVMSAGRGKDELAFQMGLASLELKRDMEYGLLQQGVGTSSPRAVKGLRTWITDNKDTVAGYVAPVYTTLDGTANTDGTTPVAFTESRLKNVLQQIFVAGGQPDTILMGPAQKQTFSAFTGNSTRFDKGEDAKVFAAVDVYVSDFGELTAIPSRFQRSRDVFVLQSDKWAIAYLRPFQTFDLATTGDAINKEILCEYAIEARAPKSSGGVYDNI
jgi:hypothetical protein